MLQDNEVQLRDLHATDLDMVWKWRNDPDVTEFLSNLRISRLQIDVWFKSYENGSHGRFFIVETKEGCAIGYTGVRDIDWHHRTAQMDIIIGEKAHWGRGYGQSAVLALLRFAFEQLELNNVCLAVLPFNDRAIRCYEKCGFNRAGFFPEKFLRRGELWQPIRMEATLTSVALTRKMKPS
ncbi:MAG: GNAT family N-acetyltransferase [Dehalococcoidia bacterium]|nr:GNAT family N-acetyltransferase [Dehalococcoidia bacterium]